MHPFIFLDLETQNTPPPTPSSAAAMPECLLLERPEVGCVRLGARRSSSWLRVEVSLWVPRFK